MSAKTSATNNNSTTSSANNTHSIQAKQLQNKHRIARARDDDEQKDALMFENLLQQENKGQQVMVTALQEQHKGNQQFSQDQEEQKQDGFRSDNIKDMQSKGVVETQTAEATHTAEFCKALTDNHNKHNFEVTLPKLGTFKIQTNASGKNLKFDVSTKEKNAYDWMTKNQSSIEKNVGKDLNLDVSLGIEYVV
jgi:hypothetical protein